MEKKLKKPATDGGKFWYSGSDTLCNLPSDGGDTHRWLMTAVTVMDRGQPGRRGRTLCHVLFAHVLLNSPGCCNKRARST